MKIRLWLLVAALLPVAPLFAQPFCSSSAPTLGICGWVQKFTIVSPQYTNPTVAYNVKVCQADANGNPTYSCQTGSTFYYCDNSGCGYSAYSFSNVAAYNQSFFVYVWNDAEHFGSSTVPLRQYTLNGCGTCGVIGNVIGTPPSPLPSLAVNPYNTQQDAPLSFTLKWTSGIDALRSGFTAVYDVYGHGYGGADVLFASGVACNPDANGNCTMAISGLKSSADYYWHVVGKIWYGNPLYAYFATTSNQFEFTTLTDPNALVSFGTNNYYNYLTGASCGGSSLLATAVGQGGCESFKVYDRNGGDLYNGEQVNVQLGSYYVCAEGGGNDVMNVNRTAAAQWETFTIYKLSGSPGSRILNGDRVAFQTYYGYYVSAVSAGGSSVNSYATYPSWQETFIYAVH